MNISESCVCLQLVNGIRLRRNVQPMDLVKCLKDWSDQNPDQHFTTSCAMPLRRGSSLCLLRRLAHMSAVYRFLAMAPAREYGFTDPRNRLFWVPLERGKPYQQ